MTLERAQHPERLDGLAAFLRPAVEELLLRVRRDHGIVLMIVHGYRSVREQWELYSRGRALNRETGEWEVVTPQAVVTKARPGLSAHNVVTHVSGEPAAVGVDLVPITGGGTPLWDLPLGVWFTIYEEAWKVGLDPLGDEIGAFVEWDKGHFEEPGWQLKVNGLGLIRPVSGVQQI